MIFNRYPVALRRILLKPDNGQIYFLPDYYCKDCKNQIPGCSGQCNGFWRKLKLIFDLYQKQTCICSLVNHLSENSMKYFP